MSKKNVQAISDTGSSIVVGPDEIVKKIADSVSAFYSNKSKCYLIDCKAEYDPVIFEINYMLYYLSKDVLTIDISFGSNLCLFGIIGQKVTTSITWVLGDPFIRAYCNIYDIGKKRIGFANTKKKIICK